MFELQFMYRDDRHGTLRAKETLKSYEIRHFVSFDGGDELGFLRLQQSNFSWDI